VAAWGPAGHRGVLAEQPAMAVCGVAGPPAGDGTWWVGGVAPNGRAAVARTGNGGRSWTTRELPLVGTARVAVLGTRVYAAVLEPGGGTLRGVFVSADRGATFAAPPARAAGALAAPPAGAPVPLLDGRLLVAAGQAWWTSGDGGATFSQGGGTLPVVGRLARTRAGFVAYGLFAAGYAAFSPDGLTWHKLNLH
ncbi:MAG TPA: hypothetical protein VES42_06950, partial [Pilimelia sp.]|nr:hypothetical protein [Pilimelia sp.]